MPSPIDKNLFIIGYRYLGSDGFASAAATITVNNQAQFDSAITVATQPGHTDTIDASTAGTIDAGTSLTLPAAATSVKLEFGTFSIGASANDGTVTLSPTASFTFGQPGNPGVLNMGYGYAGTLNINGASVIFNVTDGVEQYTRARQLNNAIGSLTGGGNVTLGAATLTTGNDGTSTAFSGAISGAGGLTKTGGGVLTLSGTSSYLGTTTIDGGVLNVTGSLTSPNVIINSGGTLSGDGTINDPTINAGGILAPGNSTASPGTLTIAGPLTFMPGSFYNVRITPTSNDFTSVIGATAINGGIVNVLAIGSGYALSTRYTILTSALGVTGTFTGVTSNLAFLTPSLSYDANDVYLTVKANINFASVALTANQFAVASALSSAARSNLSAPIIAGLENLTAEQARSAFDALSGEGIAAADNRSAGECALYNSHDRSNNALARWCTR